MAAKLNDMHRYTVGYEVFEEWQLGRYHHKSGLAHKMRSIPLGIRYLTLPHYFGMVPPIRQKMRAFGGPRTLPDFACVGALKSGTTDLASYLMQHPSILAPLTKEIGHSNTEAWKIFYPTVKEMDRVRRETGYALSGHFDPLIHNLDLIDNYYAARPDAKIVLMLRDPVKRAYSHYKWDMFLGGKNGWFSPYMQSYAQYVDLALEMFPSPTPPTSLPTVPMLATGIYVNSAKRWLDTFGKENVLVVKAEDFFDDIGKTVREIHEFLGLPPIEPDPHGVLNQNPLQFPPADEESRAKLREFYRPWNERLYDVLDRDLGWDH